MLLSAIWFGESVPSPFFGSLIRVGSVKLWALPFADVARTFQKHAMFGIAGEKGKIYRYEVYARLRYPHRFVDLK